MDFLNQNKFIFKKKRSFRLMLATVMLLLETMMQFRLILESDVESNLCKELATT